MMTRRSAPSSYPAAPPMTTPRTSSRLLRPIMQKPGFNLLFNITLCACSKPLSIDRKSTRLNSNHLGISYAVFFLKKIDDEAQHTPGLIARQERHAGNGHEMHT